MNEEATITKIEAAEILDSRGQPTLWARVTAKSAEGSTFEGEAMVPSGASTGRREALELRDGGAIWAGKGVTQAILGIYEQIAPKLQGMDVTDQRSLDTVMIDLDGTEMKEHLGANAILAVSMAAARCAAQVKGMPLYRYIRRCLLGDSGLSWVLPMPMLNILNGGAHAPNSVEIQEFMVRPIGAVTFYDAMVITHKVTAELKKLLKEQGLLGGVGDEGGFAPNLKSDAEALDLITAAITKAGYTPGRECALSLDCAATELYEDNVYVERKKLNAGAEARRRTSDEQVDYLKGLCRDYAIDSLEDGLSEDDWQGWKKLTETLGTHLQIVGDDLLVTQRPYLQKAHDQGACNAILVKLNQVGTLTETLDVIALSQSYGMGVVISHRSGETEDSFIADLAVAASTGQIKTGALCRTDRIAKYNRLLLIERELNQVAGESAKLIDGNKYRGYSVTNK